MILPFLDWAFLRDFDLNGFITVSVFQRRQFDETNEQSVKQTDAVEPALIANFRNRMVFFD
jgi:hypothetical protein